METDYFHRPCGTWLFTRSAGPYYSGEYVSGKDVTLADGSKPVSGETLRCPTCAVGRVPLATWAFRVHVRD